jgi:hypothetical protein
MKADVQATLADIRGGLRIQMKPRSSCARSGEVAQDEVAGPRRHKYGQGARHRLGERL